MYNLGIVGSRDFDDYNLFDKVIRKVISIEGKPNNIISGGARGTDSFGSKWASDNNISTIIFKPRYNDFPEKVRRWMAPKERNTDIVKNSDIILAFWNMESTGTLDSITKGRDMNKKIYIFNTNDNKLKIDNE
jgi:hypothetical protein